MTKTRQLGILVGCSCANYPTNWASSFMEGFFSTGCAFPPWDHSLDQRARKSWEVYCNSWRSAEDRVFGHILLRSMYATIVLLDMIASSKRRRPWHLFVSQAVRSCHKKRLPNYYNNPLSKFGNLWRKKKISTDTGNCFCDTALTVGKQNLTRMFFMEIRKINTTGPSIYLCFFRATVNVKVAENPK